MVGQKWVGETVTDRPAMRVREGHARTSKGPGMFTLALYALFCRILGRLEGSVPLHGLRYGPDYKAVDALSTGLCVGLDFILSPLLYSDQKLIVVFGGVPGNAGLLLLGNCHDLHLP